MITDQSIHVYTYTTLGTTKSTNIQHPNYELNWTRMINVGVML
jgi:hypothetical protein